MVSIDIDDEVFERLKDLARPFEEPTPNDVLRRLLLEEDEPMQTPEARYPRPARRRTSGESSAAFMAKFLERKFGGGFRTRSPYRTMFESPTQLVYFQNFNKADSPNLWYRLKATALKVLRETQKEAFVCLSNPAERLAYMLPVPTLLERATRSGWSGDDLEVNIDHANGRWRELDWRMDAHLVRLD